MMEKAFHYFWIVLIGSIRLALLVPLYLLTVVASGTAVLSEELGSYLDDLTARIQEWGNHDKP